MILVPFDEAAWLGCQPAEQVELPLRFQLYELVARRLSIVLTEEPPSRQRDELLLRLRDSIFRVMFDAEPTVH